MKRSQLLPDDSPVFYQPYLDTLPQEADLLELLQKQAVNFPEFLAHIPEDRFGFRYAPGKWSVAEVIGHILDAERVFQYRALRFARKDATPLPGFDQDPWIPNHPMADWTADRFIAEYEIVRSASISLFATCTEEDLLWKGTASGKSVSLGALGFIICGHQRHHRDILRTRYLDNPA